MNTHPNPAPAPRKQPAMNNPYKPIPQRPERHDETWQRRNDPVAFEAVREVSRHGY